MSKPDIYMLKLLAGIAVVMLIVTLLVNWWNPRGERFFVRRFGFKFKQEIAPERAAINRLKHLSIFYGVAILYLILFYLPTESHLIIPERLNSIGGALELQKNLDSDLQRIREVIYWALLITVFWLWAVYRALAVAVFGVVKETNSEAASKDASRSG